jgi:hypothetical protein
MEEPSNQPEESPGIVCGQCGQAIEQDETEPVNCPHCGAELSSPQWAESEEPVDEPEALDAEDELSALRIRQISALRRAADRARSYCLIGLVVLVVGAGQLAIMIVHNVRASGWHLLEVGYAVAAITGVFFAWRLGGRVVVLTKELRQPLQSDPVEPPDFSTLNDGSQRVRHLEEM